MDISLKTLGRAPLANAETQNHPVPRINPSILSERLAKDRNREKGWKAENLADHIVQIVFAVTPQGRGEYFNPYWENYTGLSEEQSLELGWMRAFHHEDIENAIKRLGGAIQTESWEFEARIQRASDGSYRWHLCRCSPIGDGQDAPTGLVVCCADIEEWRNAEVTAKERGVLLGLSMRTQDEERRKIAHNLHDSSGQYLIALHMKLEALQRMALGSTGRKNLIVDDCRELVKRCSREIRSIAYLLYPPLLDELGLESAVHLYVSGFVERTKTKVELDIDPNLGRLDRELEIALFRVVQEGLANIHARYFSEDIQVKIGAGPTSVFVEVTALGGRQALPGKFIDSSHQPSAVVIGSLKQRIQEAGGLFEIRQVPNGLIIRAIVPRRALVAHACD